MKKVFIYLLFVFILVQGMEAQSFQIIHYGIEEGLPYEQTYNILQDANGYIWIATTEGGLCRLDGSSFYSEFRGDTLPTSDAREGFSDSHGLLWYGYSDGQIAFYKNQQFKVISLDNINSPIIGFEEDRQAAGNMKPEGLDFKFFYVYDVLYETEIFEEMNHAASHKLSL